MIKRGTLLASVAGACTLLFLTGTGCLLKKGDSDSTTAAAIPTASPTPSPSPSASPPPVQTGGPTGTVATLNMSGSAAPVENICTLLTLTALDADGNAVSADGDVTYDVVNISSNGRFFTDSGCSQGLSTSTFPEGSSTLAIYFSDDAPESASAYAEVNSVQGTTWTATVARAHIAQIGFTNGSAGNGTNGTIYTGSQSGGPCTEFLIHLEDGNGNPILEQLGGGPATTLTFSVTSGGGGFYSDNQCSSGHSATTTSIPGGNAYANPVYFGGSMSAVGNTAFSTSVTDTYGTYTQDNTFNIQ